MTSPRNPDDESWRDWIVPLAPPPFVMISSDRLREIVLELPPLSKMMFMLLLHTVSPATGEAHLSRSALAVELGLSPKITRTALADLESRGLIETNFPRRGDGKLRVIDYQYVVRVSQRNQNAQARFALQGKPVCLPGQTTGKPSCSDGPFPLSLKHESVSEEAPVAARTEEPPSQEVPQRKGTGLPVPPHLHEQAKAAAERRNAVAALDARSRRVSPVRRDRA